MASKAHIRRRERGFWFFFHPYEAHVMKPAALCTCPTTACTSCLQVAADMVRAQARARVEGFIKSALDVLKARTRLK